MLGQCHCTEIALESVLGCLILFILVLNVGKNNIIQLRIGHPSLGFFLVGIDRLEKSFFCFAEVALTQLIFSL